MIDKILFIFSKKEKFQFLYLILILNFGVFLEMLSIGIIFPTLLILIDPSKSFEFLNKLNIEIDIKYSESDIILYLLIVIVFIFLIKNLTLFYLQKKQAFILANYNEKLSKEIFKRYLDQSIRFLLKNNTSLISRNIIEVPNLFSNHYIQSILNLFMELIMLIGVLIILLNNNFILTISAILILTPLASLIFLINKKELLKSGEESKLHWGERLKQIQETFAGILEVKSFNKENTFYEKYKFHNKKITDVSIKLSVINIIPKLIFEFIIIVIICGGVFYLINQNKNIIDAIPTIGLFSYAFIRLLPSLNKILVSLQRIKYSSAIVDEIFFIKKSLISNSIKEIKKLEFKDNIEIKNLDFEYIKSEKILSNLNLKLKKNSIVGIYGESGTGKSTFLKILMGLLSPASGNISVDGFPISENIKSWQKIVGYVPQNVFIMDNSLKFNISLLDKDDQINYDKVEEAISLTNLKEFKDKLAKGLDANLGEVGQKISGGQKQRIGIARAIYANPQVLVLDESTSNLDDDTEIEILEELSKLRLKRNLTIIIVSHKPAIKNYCDTLYEIKNKSIYKIK